MEPLDLELVASELARTAEMASSGRAARTIYGAGHQDERTSLRQTILAMKAGTQLGEHESPGQASLHVLTGHVRLTAGTSTWLCPAGRFMEIPRERHSLEALDNSILLLTVASSSNSEAQ